MTTMNQIIKRRTKTIRQKIFTPGEMEFLLRLIRNYKDSVIDPLPDDLLYSNRFYTESSIIRLADAVSEKIINNSEKKGADYELG